jgi:hypothetical protein
MRMHQTILSLLIVMSSSVGVQSVALPDEYRGTMQQQIACTPDVFRLCGNAIPDVNRIVSCLRQNEPQLGAPCRAVFESNADASRDTPRGTDPAKPYSDH